MPAPASPAPPCPYPGMRAYSSSENHFFFGRDTEARELEESLRSGARELILSGSSGCGKTSLVQAGLIPRLSAPPLDATYSVSTLSAEPDPLVALERAVRDFDSRQRMLLVIDTLETVLTLPPSEQQSFFDTLALLRRDTRLQFLFVLSSEFQDLFAPSLFPWLAKAPSVPLEPLRDQQLARALTEPARAVGIELEPALVIKLCDDAAQEPGAMPLLQHTMCMLWRNLDATTLSLHAYQHLTEQQGLGRAARRHAQAVLGDSADPPLAMRILLRLVHFCYGRPHTRYRRAEPELLDDLERERPSLKHLVDSGLVTHVGPSYDLAHDTLIHSWAELSRYVTEHADAEKERRSWQARAESRRDRGGGLLDLEDLHAAEAWRKRAAATVGCSPLLADYLEESRRAIQEQKRRADLTQTRQYLVQAQSHLQGARGAKAAPYLVAARELLDKHGALTLPERLLFGWAKRSLPIAPSWLPLRWDTSVKGDLTSPNGAYVARVDADGLTLRVHIAAPAPREPQRPKDTPSSSSPLLELPTQITHLVWSDDSRYLAVRCGVQDFVFDAIDPKEPPADRANGVAPAPLPSPRNDRLATANGKLVRITAAGAARSPDLDHKEQVVALAWSLCSTCLATATDNRTIHIWDATMGYQVQRELVATGPVRNLEWTAEQALRITTEEHSYERHLDPTDLADWRAVADKSPYHLVEGVLLRKEPTRP